MISSALIQAVSTAQRPVFIWGAGIRNSAARARTVAEDLAIPVACTWGAIDLLPHDHPLMTGGFGTHGSRAANFAVQNSDLVVSIGSRLDTKATGIPSHFARAAKVCMVDLDVAELRKLPQLGRTIDWPVQQPAEHFLTDLHLNVRRDPPAEWLATIQAWKKKWSTTEVTWPGVNPYELMPQIAEHTTKDDILCTDTGFALGWTMQAFPFKGERFLHAFNMTPMGYGLPAAVGAAFASGRRVILITGDGSLMMSLSELATVTRWQLPIKVILLNNQGHGMCRQTQRQWLGGTYPATSIAGGLAFPDFVAVAASCGIQPYDCEDPGFWETPEPAFMQIEIHPDAQLVPQARYGQPIEDADPLLPWDEFNTEMIIAPLRRT